MNKASSERYIYEQLRQVFPDATRNRLMNLKNREFEIDVFVDSLPLAIEYDSLHHRRRIKKDESKNYRLQQAGIPLIRIRELGLPPLQRFGALVIPHNPQDPDDLDRCIQRLFEEINHRYRLPEEVLVQIQKWATGLPCQLPVANDS